MKKPRFVAFVLRSFSVQLFAVTVLPLTLLLLVIAFGSVALHERDMRMLVGERDERAVQAAAAALEAELHHRAATISSLVAGDDSLPAFDVDMASDFDGGLAMFDPQGGLLYASPLTGPSAWLSQNAAVQSRTASTEPVFSDPFSDPSSKRRFVIISAYSPSQDVIVAGAFSPETLASETLSASYPAGSNARIYLVDSARQLLYVSGALAPEVLPFDHPGIAEALAGKTGTLYVQRNNTEHVVAYSPISLTGWALITEEEWEMVISPSLQLTQLAPLVLVPAFILALIALWFGARQIVQPLQRLESKAAALTWGDFNAIQESVGGISEVRHLQRELTEMARKVQAAQEGLRDYIGAITAAQEEERLRLARELHDDTIQAVIALKQRVQLAEKLLTDPNGRRSLQELETLAEKTIDNLRRMTRALRPIYLEDLGLVTALEMLARETGQNNSLPVDFHKSGAEQRLSHETELAFYRIAQEALNNVVRHSNAKHAGLRINFGNDEINLEVSDDGVGFQIPRSPTDFAPGGHFGLLGMRERSELIGAKLEVRSKAGGGTRLSVRLPIRAGGIKDEQGVQN